ncbi:MAG: hypothetical protein Kow0059_02340 [Candidatus Sumerlaeia bacterium]
MRTARSSFNIRPLLFGSGLLWIMFVFTAPAQTADAPWLYGIHWWRNNNDPEAMSGGKGLWAMEITHVDASVAPAWDQPSYFASTHCPPAAGKGHSFVFRMQPYWSRNVPHSSDPYTLGNYTSDAQAAANTLINYVHVWQIGNEVNLEGENMRWNSSTSAYDIPWQPTPEQYAAVYEALRDAIHNVTPNTTPATQIVLMQPVSPGNMDMGAAKRFMDGNEFLWRQILGVSNPAKIDGFALHSYAEPGGANYGVDGFMDALREQIMVIDQAGLHDRPIFITEFNKEMPNAAEANIGARFLHRAFTALHDWNTATGGAWPGVPNHNIVAATWFVYPSGVGWDNYSLEYWKTQIASTDKEFNPWYSFQYAAGLNYAKGTSGGGGAVPMNVMWWEDEFNGGTLDTTPPLPDWYPETTGAGSVVMSGGGQVRLLGNGSVNGGGGIRTRGYVYRNFRLSAEVVITNAARSSTTVPEANFDLRLREGSRGYSITFFTSASPTNTNRIVLRRTNEWTQIGSFNELISGGINSGDVFRIEVLANGSSIDIEIFKNNGPAPVVNWAVNDGGQNIGWIRLMTWNLNEARINYVRLGGPQWSGAPAGVENWMVY